jgi:ring-1,2-phenylacetyl-CoA epoxidase subunit PaaC
MNNFLTNYILHLADTTLILAQRNAEWCGHGPILEQDIAITNISLDLLGQSRNFYQYAAHIINASENLRAVKAPFPLERAGGEVDEDKLAYLRTEREFKNLLLAEQPNGDWGQTILRLYLFSQFQYLLFERLQHSKDEQLAAITTKALKEIKYHVRWSSEWVVRLGDGTTESKTRMVQAIDELWRYTGEIFVPADYEDLFAIDFAALKNDWLQKVTVIFQEATLTIPESTFMQSGGKTGMHTEHLGYILTDLQYMQRTYPNSQW